MYNIFARGGKLAYRKEIIMKFYINNKEVKNYFENDINLWLDDLDCDGKLEDTTNIFRFDKEDCEDDNLTSDDLNWGFGDYENNGILYFRYKNVKIELTEEEQKILKGAN